MIDSRDMVIDGPKASVHDDLMRFKPAGVSPNGWAVLAGLNRTVWADMKRHDNPSRRTLEKLLVAAGSSLAEFEALRLGPHPPAQEVPDRFGAVEDRGVPGWRGAALPPIPIFATACAEADGIDQPIACATLDRSQSLGSVARPASLAADHAAFALSMWDDTMWPRF